MATLAVTAVILFGNAHSGLAANPAAASLEALNANLLDLGVRYREARGAGRSRLRAELKQVAKARWMLLGELVASDPGAVLRLTLPATTRAAFPRTVRGHVEREVEVEGTLEVLVEDSVTGSRTHHILTTRRGKRFSLHFASEPPGLESGSWIRVRGVQIDRALALDGASTSISAMTAAFSNTFGAQRTVVLLVNFRDKAVQPYTVDYARRVVFTTTSDFYREGSSQQTWLTGDVFGWYTIALDSTVCDTGKIASYARSAATAAGVDLSSYSRFVYAFPDNACSWWGLGSVGGNPSSAWINGSFQLVVVGHEVGHNLGLRHSHALECGSATIGGSCSSIEYGDTIDIMGIPSAGHFTAFQKEQIGWLNYGASPPITTVTSAGTYWIDAFETSGTGPKALKIPKTTDPTTGRTTWYYVEIRRPLGFDTFLASNANVLGGVVVHTGTDATGTTSYLLDLTPATSSWSDPALAVGQSFSDPDAGVTITPLSVGDAGGSVNVSFGAPTCASAQPTVALAPQSVSVPPATTVAYTVTVTNRDTSACSATRFGLAAAVPAGWSANLAASALTLAPGASGSTTLAVAAPATQASGTYAVQALATSASDPAYVASGSASMTVVRNFAATVTTDRASYKRNQSVAITARVTADGAGAAGVTVSLAVTRPNGVVVRQVGTTDAGGAARFSLQLKRKDPLGTYQVTAEASLAPALAASAATSFIVQ